MQFKRVKQAVAAGLWVGAAAALAQTPVPLASAPTASAPSIRGLPAAPVDAQQRALAERVAQQGVALSELAPDAPARYTVKAGDTLWAISGLYLKQPWHWPELWGMNMAQIRNPHWIFPGQTLVLTVRDGRAQLSVESTDPGDGVPEVRLEPGVVSSDAPPIGIPTLDPALLAPFLTRPLIVDASATQQAPHIVALAPGHVMLSVGDRAFVRGKLGAATQFDIYRPAQPLHEPGSKKVLALASDYLGAADLVQGPQGKDAISTVEVVSIARDIGAGDLLTARTTPPDLNFTPKAPAVAVAGQIIALDGDAEMAGRNSVVTLDRGSADGLQSGDVLAVMQAAREVTDSAAPDKPAVEIPPQRVGLLMVFRTFDHVAYGVVLEAQQALEVADGVTSP
jgi:hypothetical protein